MTTAAERGVPMLAQPPRKARGGEYDYFNALPPTKRRYLLARMSRDPDALRIEDLASDLGCTIDEAWAWWVGRLTQNGFQGVGSYRPADEFASLTDDHSPLGFGLRASHTGDSLLDSADVASLLSVELETVKTWTYRKVLPPATHRFSDRPVWLESTIRRWGAETGRLGA